MSRNEDEPAPAGRLRLWTIGQFSGALQGFALAGGRGGEGSPDGESELKLEQAFLRYSIRPARMMLEAGKFVTPIGNFSRRYLSTANPLIGSPDSYGVDYPVGVEASGRVSRLDYSVAVIDRPIVNQKYVPKPGRALRPTLAAGVTPLVGARLGAFATRGPYLGEEAQSMLMPGDRWRDFDQSLYGLELEFSRGHFELHGEWVRSAYEVPGMSREVRGEVWFIEPKVTFTPRLFGALRLERNDYPFIQPLAPGSWLGVNAEFSDVEAAVGYRLFPSTILKLAYRKDHWNVERGLKPTFRDGYAIGFQLSWSFDANSWFDRPL